ncbi:MAG: ATP-binding protein [Lachnospiraceae bacterium]|nr:ATP-binding protein [Lachnospiraceae bacterium]
MVRQVAKKLASLFCDEKIDVICVLGGPYVGKSWLVNSCISKDDKIMVFDDINSYDDFLKLVKAQRISHVKYIIIGRLLDEKCRQLVGEDKRIRYVNVYPMNFAEFRLAIPKNNCIEQMEMLKLYMLVGGLPEVVKVFLETGNIEKVRCKQLQLLGKLEGQMNRKERAIVKSVIVQEQCEATGFFLSKLDRNARKREYAEVLSGLLDMGIIEKQRRFAPKENLEVRKYKLYIYDMGLYLAAIGIDIKSFMNCHKSWDEKLLYKFYLLDLRTYIDKSQDGLMYWSRHKGKANISIIIKMKYGEDDLLFPIGIKEKVELLAKSTQVFIKEYDGVRPINVKIPSMEEVEDGQKLYDRMRNTT